MARKSEAVAQKKDRHENRNAVIAGFLLALLPIIIFLWAFYFQPGSVQSVESTASYQNCEANCPPNHVCCMAAVLPTLGYRLYMLLPTFYELVYLPLGVLLYLLSMLGLSDVTKSKLRFAGKSFFAGGIIGLVLFTIAIFPIFGRYM